MKQKWQLVWLGPKLWEHSFIPDQVLNGISLSRQVTINGTCFGLHSCDWSAAFAPDIARDYSILVVRPALGYKIGHAGDRERAKAAGRTGYSVEEVVAEWKKRGVQKFIVISPGEERSKTSCTCGSCGRLVDMAPLLIRNYATPDCAARTNVIQWPLGVKEGQVPGKDVKNNPVSARSVLWSFSSRHTTLQRTEMVNKLKNWSPKWKSSSVFKCIYPGTDKDYMATLANSVFVAVPAGNVPDTWRMYEVLESGAIPIWLHTRGSSYFTKFFPPSLVYLLAPGRGTDAGLFAKLDALLSDLAALEAHRMKVVAAYAEWRTALRRQMRCAVAEVAAGVRHGGVRLPADSLWTQKESNMAPSWWCKGGYQNCPWFEGMPERHPDAAAARRASAGASAGSRKMLQKSEGRKAAPSEGGGRKEKAAKPAKPEARKAAKLAKSGSRKNSSNPEKPGGGKKKILPLDAAAQAQEVWVVKQRGSIKVRVSDKGPKGPWKLGWVLGIKKGRPLVKPQKWDAPHLWSWVMRGWPNPNAKMPAAGKTHAAGKDKDKNKDARPAAGKGKTPKGSTAGKRSAATKDKEKRPAAGKGKASKRSAPGTN